MISSATVIIFGYNSAARIGEVLSCIASQEIPEGVQIDVLVMENAPEGNTPAEAQITWRKLNSPFPLRTLKEKKEGLVYSREAAIRNCKSEILFFVDDDNLLGKNYISNALRIFDQHPGSGIVCGEIFPKYSAEPSAWFRAFENVLAVGKQGEAEGDISGQKGFAWGAGMVVRRAALSRIYDAGFDFTRQIHKGKLMGYADDYELSLFVRLAGFKIFYSPSLTLHHVISASKLNRTYLEQLNYMQGFSGVVLDGPNYFLKDKEVKGTGILFTWLRETFYCVRMIAGGIFSSSLKARLRKKYYSGRLNNLLRQFYKGYAASFNRVREIRSRLS